MIKLSLQKFTYLANSTSLTLSAFLCWMKARPWHGLGILFYISIHMINIGKIIDPKARMSKLIFLYEIRLHLYLEHLYGDKRNMWGLS